MAGIFATNYSKATPMSILSAQWDGYLPEIIPKPNRTAVSSLNLRILGIIKNSNANALTAPYILIYSWNSQNILFNIRCYHIIK